MRKLTILIILVATAAVALSQEPPKTAVAQSDAQKTAANIIIGAERKAWEAMKNKDAKFFEANLSADSSMIRATWQRMAQGISSGDNGDDSRRRVLPAAAQSGRHPGP